MRSEDRLVRRAAVRRAIDAPGRERTDVLALPGLLRPRVGEPSAHNLGQRSAARVRRTDATRPGRVAPAAAIVGLAECAGARAVSRIRSFLREPSASVRQAALHALSALDADIVARCHESLADPAAG
jgi:hypothetical protein